MIFLLHHIKRKISTTPLSLWFFYALIFFLPFGIDKIWLSPKSYYFGYLAFYNTFHLYLTDLIFVGLILAWFWEVRGKISVKWDALNLSLVTFWLILAISTLFSRETALSLYGLIKITQYLLLFVYIREKIELSRERLVIFWLILATFSIQSIIAIVQYLGQSSLGLGILGEEWLRPGLKGVAEFVSREITNPLFYNFFSNLSQNSDILIRGYGTLPHPNVLSGLLFVGVVLNIFLLYRPKANKLANFILAATLVLLSAGLVVTFSRITWAVAALAIFAWFAVVFIKIRKPQSAGLVAMVLALAVFLNLFIFGPAIKSRLLDKGAASDFASQESIANRDIYNQIAFAMIKQQPLLGVGLKTFVSSMDDFSKERLLPYMHQPAHNIYLLIAAEAGIGALLIFCVVIYNIVRRWLKNQIDPVLKYSLLIMFAGLLTIGLFDHYFWTIEAGSLLFWISLGLLTAKT